METLRSDLTYVLRSTRRRPGIALLCVLTLSLGVGAGVAERQTVFESMAYAFGSMTFSGDGPPRKVQVHRAT
jgi:hypothetical protein